MPDWTESVKLQLVLEFIRAYRFYYKIAPGVTIPRGGDELAGLSMFIESLAHTPEYQHEWLRLRENASKIDVALTKRLLEAIQAHKTIQHPLVRLLPNDYWERLAKKLASKLAVVSALV